MCDICGHTPCDYRCPNAPDPEPIYQCSYCNRAIVVGDLYFHHNDKYYHDDCFGDAAPSLVVEEKSLVAGVVTDEDTQIGVCPICKEPVLTSEERWVGDGVVYHHECLLDNARAMLHPVGLYADNEY